ncbi:hypothetical protein CAEBREN_05025 [Caenorhabditis brenneri]|uniref:G-protein coupled receptors family 1 profile domain-containing protein n=1 Tax=Caenorhabditis brenneri TaxID=135651 RepID=G0NN25_CAEBE|nr:hypothetical protein CAEBREN_05025 [Caenorhabditis brenneri]
MCSLAASKIVPDHTLMSIVYVKIDGVYPSSNFLALAYDLISTVTCIVCYTFVLRSVRKSSQNVASNVQKSRNHQDVRYLFQFVFISIFYIFIWTFFEVLNLMVTDVPIEFWIIVPIFVIFNCSSNAIIYLSVNREIQKLIRIPWNKKNQSNSVHVIIPAGVSDNL